MNTVGIIAEYNPFHTGHSYHLKKARQLSGCSFCTVILSPDFVQRGEPALLGKYERAKMALRSGADLVIELPVCYSTGSAEYFARGACALLEAIGVTECLCFGAETGTEEDFQEAAVFLGDETAEYSALLSTLLRSGLTFPKAREQAANSVLKQYKKRAFPDSFLSSPNNILGIEYAKALAGLHSPIRLLPLRRKGNAYHDTSLSGSFCSASAMRREIGKAGPAFMPGALLPYIPDSCLDIWDECLFNCVFPEDLCWYLYQRLLSLEDFSQYLDVSPDLNRRICHLRFQCMGKSWREILTLLKTKQLTEARVRRALLHIILQICLEDVNVFLAQGTVFYAKVLGFKKSAAPLLRQIKEKSSIPLLTKNSAAKKQLSPLGQKMLSQDLFASHLYRSIQSGKHHLPFVTEQEISPVILD